MRKCAQRTGRGETFSNLSGRRAGMLALCCCALLAGCDGSAGEPRAPAPDAAAPGLDAASVEPDAASVELDAAGPRLDAAPRPAEDAAAAPADSAAPELDAAPIDLTGLPELCGRPRQDGVRDVFCVPGAPARIGSLRELQAALGINAIPLDMDEAAAAQLAFDPFAISDQVVFLGHSTALSGRVVSAINPRALILGRTALMAYQRGVQQVEIVSPDRANGVLNFYLLSFRQACNDGPRGCLPGDLYTARVERDWTAVELRDDEDLKNTPSDCRQCHQRGLTRPMLLMRELRAPWTHFFAPDPNDEPYAASVGSGSRDLARAFKQVKTGEIYAGIPAVLMRHTVGFSLENLVPDEQPLEFPALEVEVELAPQMPSSGAPRRSPTWDAAFQAFKRGEQLALPHFLPNPADPEKQARLSEAYQRYRSQQLAAEQLPDLADIFPDDPQVRAEIGLQVEPGATPAQALIQACCPCHNDVLDQSISRARFNVALSRMSRSELDLAIERVLLAPGAPAAMPPPESRQLTDEVRARLVAYLRQTERPAQDDALLEQAAALGMAKERWPGMRAP